MLAPARTCSGNPTKLRVASSEGRISTGISIRIPGSSGRVNPGVVPAAGDSATSVWLPARWAVTTPVWETLTSAGSSEKNSTRAPESTAPSAAVTVAVMLPVCPTRRLSDSGVTDRVRS